MEVCIVSEFKKSIVSIDALAAEIGVATAFPLVVCSQYLNMVPLKPTVVCFPFGPFPLPSSSLRLLAHYFPVKSSGSDV
jgi:hypothetical protein